MLIKFKQPILIENYKVDIVKVKGKIENPYLMHGFASKDENGAASSMLFKIGNIDINDGRYKVSFLSK